MPRLLVLLLTLIPFATLAEPMHMRAQGSNTIGAALLPALVQGQLHAQQATAIEQQPGKRAGGRWGISHGAMAQRRAAAGRGRLVSRQ